MQDLPLLIILVVISLSFVSALLYINLRSQHIASARVVRVLLELWGVFALIIGIFAYISHLLGSTPSGSMAEELTARLAHWHTLARVPQVIILVGAICALGLFVHLLISLHTLQSRPHAIPSPQEGDVR
jgi:hypothetical protein